MRPPSLHTCPAQALSLLAAHASFFSHGHTAAASSQPFRTSLGTQVGPRVGFLEAPPRIGEGLPGGVLMG